MLIKDNILVPDFKDITPSFKDMSLSQRREIIIALQLLQDWSPFNTEFANTGIFSLSEKLRHIYNTEPEGENIV